MELMTSERNIHLGVKNLGVTTLQAGAAESRAESELVRAALLIKPSS